MSKWEEAAGGGGGGGREYIQNQRKEPHTKMWGKRTQHNEKECH